jgi:replicative DNA helicase
MERQGSSRKGERVNSEPPVNVASVAQALTAKETERKLDENSYLPQLIEKVNSLAQKLD